LQSFTTQWLHLLLGLPV